MVYSFLLIRIMFRDIFEYIEKGRMDYLRERLFVFEIFDRKGTRGFESVQVKNSDYNYQS